MSAQQTYQLPTIALPGRPGAAMKTTRRKSSTANAEITSRSCAGVAFVEDRDSGDFTLSVSSALQPAQVNAGAMAFREFLLELRKASTIAARKGRMVQPDEVLAMIGRHGGEGPSYSAGFQAAMCERLVEMVDGSIAFDEDWTPTLASE